MLERLVNKLWKGKNRTTTAELEEGQLPELTEEQGPPIIGRSHLLTQERRPRLTKEQKQSVKEGFSLFDLGYIFIHDGFKERYLGIVTKLIESEEGYSAFERWIEGAHAWPGYTTKSDPHYLEASENLLSIAPANSLAAFGEFISRVSQHLDSFKQVYLEKISEIVVCIAKEHPEALDQLLETTPEVIAALNQLSERVHIGVYSQKYLETSEMILQAASIDYLVGVGNSVKGLIQNFSDNRNNSGIALSIYDIEHYLEQMPQLARLINHRSPDALDKIIAATIPLAKAGVLPDRYFECIFNAAKLLDSSSFNSWLDDGLKLLQEEPKRVRTYFSIYSQLGQASIRKHMPGIGLEEVRDVLQLYSRALAGTGFILKSMNGNKNTLGRPYTDGTNMWLPDRLHGYGSEEDNFQAYKVLATIHAAKVEFGTFALQDKDIQSLVEQLEAKYGSKTQGDTPLQHFYNAFPHPELAQTLFELIEGKRIINRIRENYRGIKKTLDKVIRREIELRPLSDRASDGIIVLESLAQYLALDTIPSTIPGHIKSVVETLYQLASPATTPEANVVASLYATAACYELFHPKSAQEEKTQQGQQQTPPQHTELNIEKGSELPSFSYQGRFEMAQPSLEVERKSNEVNGRFTYPQWSIVTGGYLLNWCEVKEFELKPAENVPPPRNGTAHLQMAQLFERMYYGLSEKRRHEPQGDDINTDALVEFMADRAAGVSREPDFYIQRRRRPEGIAAAFLIDASPSASFFLNDGRRVIDAERESLELLVAGMEQMGHTYGIFGFSGLVRNNVRVYVIKGLNSKFDRSRLYSLEPMPINKDSGEPVIHSNNSIITVGTYTGPAIRHITQLLADREEAAKVLFLLTDSDVQAIRYYGEYARVDVRMAFLEAKRKGVYPFAISFGNNNEGLSRMYGRDFITITQPQQLVRQLPRIYIAITR